MILMLGFIVFRATAQPAIKPPPPTGMTQASKSGTCSNTSNASVPCPAKMCGWSYLKESGNE